jgi:predicted Zn finger-like uncharacterized protein
MSGTGDAKGNMYVKCPQCQMEFRMDDIVSTLDKGNFKCHVCGEKFPSPLAEHKYTDPSARAVKHRSPVLIFLGIVLAVIAIHFLASAAKTSLFPDKIQTVTRIAAEFHKNHTYTQEGDFVCLDMAISVWNQLTTNGIEAKIMGGNVKEDITGWNYRQLASKSNHAWVVAKVSPTEKVAIETTAGVIIKPGMKDASAYFRGIEFDNPSQIKKFEFLKKKANEVCQDAKHLITDWNDNVADKQRRSEEIIAKQSKVEQRKQDCENTLNAMEEFRSRAICN